VPLDKNILRVFSHIHTTNVKLSSSLASFVFINNVLDSWYFFSVTDTSKDFFVYILDLDMLEHIISANGVNIQIVLIQSQTSLFIFRSIVRTLGAHNLQQLER